MSDTTNSLILVANSVDALLQRTYSMAFYVSNDENIRSMLREDFEDNNNGNLSEQERRLRLLNRINRFGGIVNNLSFNMIDKRAYLTVFATDSQMYTNWSYTGVFSKVFSDNISTGEANIWTGFESNYVASDRNRLQY